jgi:hypothetical protein
MTAPRKKPAPIQQLVAAMDRCAVSRGEAQWTNGYRAANKADEHRLWSKEQAQWWEVGRADDAFRRLAARLLRAERKRGVP